MELNVAATLRVMPEGPEVNLDSIILELEKIGAKYGKVHSKDVKPVAFGLKAIEIAYLLNDSKGGMDEIEAEIMKIAGVGSVEITDVNRL